MTAFLHLSKRKKAETDAGDLDIYDPNFTRSYKKRAREEEAERIRKKFDPVIRAKTEAAIERVEAARKLRMAEGEKARKLRMAEGEKARRAENEREKKTSKYEKKMALASLIEGRTTWLPPSAREKRVDENIRGVVATQEKNEKVVRQKKLELKKMNAFNLKKSAIIKTTKEKIENYAASKKLKKELTTQKRNVEVVRRKTLKVEKMNAFNLKNSITIKTMKENAAAMKMERVKSLREKTIKKVLEKEKLKNEKREKEAVRLAKEKLAKEKLAWIRSMNSGMLKTAPVSSIWSGTAKGETFPLKKKKKPPKLFSKIVFPKPSVPRGPFPKTPFPKPSVPRGPFPKTPFPKPSVKKGAVRNPWAKVDVGEVARLKKINMKLFPKRTRGKSFPKIKPPKPSVAPLGRLDSTLDRLKRKYKIDKR